MGRVSTGKETSVAEKKRTLGDSLSLFFGSLRGIVDMRAIPDPPNHRREQLSPVVDMIVKLAEQTRGWKVAIKDLSDRGCLSVQLWTDQLTGARLVIVFRTGAKGAFPAYFMPVPTEQEVDPAVLTAVGMVSGDFSEMSDYLKAA